MDPLPDLYAAPGANDRRVNRVRHTRPFELAAILFAFCSAVFLTGGCLSRTTTALGWLGASRNPLDGFVANLLVTRDHALLVLLSLSAYSLDAHQRWRTKFTLLALCVIALQLGLALPFALLGLNLDWTYSAIFASSLATSGCFVWTIINSLRKRSGIAVGIALLIAMPMLHVDPTDNRAVALFALAALPDCSRQLTVPVIACGFCALEHLASPDFTHGVSWTVAALWLVLRGRGLASAWPVGSCERAALRAGFFLVALSLLLEQVHVWQQTYAKARVTGTPFADMAWLATLNGSAMIVVAMLLREVHPISLTALRMRVVVGVWFIAALGVVFSQPHLLPMSVSTLTMGVLLVWSIDARLRVKPVLAT